MQALIDPTVSVQHLVAWDENDNPVYETYPNSARVCQVSDPFEVAPPLFWVDCNSDVVADQWWYDTQTGVLSAIDPGPPPPQPQPVVQGAQTL